MTEAYLKLTNKPEIMQAAVAAFPTLKEAVATGSKVVHKGHLLAAMELLDDVRAVSQGGYSD